MYIEVFIIAAILIFVYIYRRNTGNNSYKFIQELLVILMKNMLLILLK